MFVTPLRLRYVSADRWEVASPFKVFADPHIRVVVGTGFLTDLTSVPRIPGLYAWLKARAVRSAVVHDWLWRVGFPRADADRLFRRLVLAETDSHLLANAMYCGVRLGSLMRRKNPDPLPSHMDGGVYVWSRSRRAWTKEW